MSQKAWIKAMAVDGRVAVVGWQLAHWIGCVIPSILSGRNAKIGALLSELCAFNNKKHIPPKKAVTKTAQKWTKSIAVVWMYRKRNCAHFDTENFRFQALSSE
jgi:hypothetical protein